MKPVILILGGTGCIGREVTRQALKADWRVIIHGSRSESVESVTRDLLASDASASVRGLAADIREAGAIEKLIADAGQLHDRIDAVVDCAVTGPTNGNVVGPFENSDPVAYLELMELSIVYLQRVAFAALPWLKASRGCLVAFTSDAALYAAPRQALIGAARAATVGFIRNFAMEVAREGVRAHCISPSFVLQTETAWRLEKLNSGRLEKAQQRAGLGLPTPTDIAPMVLFLCGSGAKCITGQVISINGGLHT